MDEIKKAMQDTNTQFQEIVNLVTEFLVKYSFNMLGAAIILILGFWIAAQVSAMFGRFLTKKGFDITLTHFFSGVVKFLIIFFALIMALDKLGITMTPFVAALSGAAFGASFAFQGPLMNYGAGLTIILTRPFVVGDTITVAECSGVVEDISLALTTLKNEDGVRITIPNKHIVGEVLYNSKRFKVVDQKIGISYASDTRAACELALRVLASQPDVTQQPKPQVGIAEFGDSSIQLALRYWVPTEKYYQTLFAVNQAVYEALKAEGVTIPFPQREVRIVGGKV
jgi:small conductance mechanosensitive channel